MPRPRLAINYSPEALALLDEGVLELDLIKLPAWPDLVARVRAERPEEVYVHFGFHLGTSGLDPEQLDLAAEYLEQGLARHLNCHLAPSSREAGAGQVERELGELVERFSAGRILVENVPWMDLPDYPIDALAAEPVYVSEVVHAHGCGLLLDLAHARISCLELGLDEREHLTAHPVEALRELHVTGVARVEGGPLRDSMPFSAADWELVTWALDRIADGDWPTPEIIALEYGGIGSRFEWRTDARVLREQGPRLIELLRERDLR